MQKVKQNQCFSKVISRDYVAIRAEFPKKSTLDLAASSSRQASRVLVVAISFRCRAGVRSLVRPCAASGRSEDGAEARPSSRPLNGGLAVFVNEKGGSRSRPLIPYNSTSRQRPVRSAPFSWSNCQLPPTGTGGPQRGPLQTLHIVRQKASSNPS